MKHFGLLTALMVLHTAASSQFIRCGNDVHQFKDLLASQHLKRSLNTSGFTAGIDTLVIPVVVHVLYFTEEENISDEQVKSQIDVLNEDYSGSNGTAAEIPDAWKHMLGDSKIRFKLAAQTPGPSIQNTNGIIRKKVMREGFFHNDNSIKITANGGSDPWPASAYLNIWVCRLLDDVLGFAPFPGVDSLQDGVVINYKAFGRIGELASKYNYGRTATHEVGHWLNLIHIWGDTPDCDPVLDDQIEDTPLQGDANYCCPKFPKLDNCQQSGNGVMYMNYMDYTDDKFMQFFTPDQLLRMDTAINDYRSSLYISQGDEAFLLPANDLEIADVTLPLHETPTRCFSPLITIRNNGQQPAGFFSIKYRMYKGNERRYLVEQVIDAGSVLQVNLPEISGKEGLNILELSIAESDGNTVNNYLSRSFFSPENTTACYQGDPFIYPNPVTGSSFCVRSGFNESFDIIVRIVNSRGQYIYEEKRPSNPGDVFNIPFERMPDGVYYIQLIGKDDNSMSSKFIYFPEGSSQSCE